ncbi:hypothetical protein [Novosphingobium sp.]|uniref:hypothetical protein n=1 Tax=Novosphingobium sp. TaxID=1874826 RepID=UPI002FDEC679
MTTSELMEAMAKAGAPFEAILIAVRAIEHRDAALAEAMAAMPVSEARRRSAGALRQQRYREKKKAEETGVVTVCDVTRDAESDGGCDAEHNGGATPVTPVALSLPPNEKNSNPPTHTHPDILPAREEVPLGSEFGPQQVLEMWNRAAVQIDLPKAAKLSDARRRHAAKLIREHGEEGFRAAIRAIMRSRFLRGENDRGWKADLDFLLQPKSFLKLIEGAYDRSNRARTDRRHEPDAAMAILQQRLGLAGDPDPSGEAGRWDDAEAGGGHFLPGYSA